MYEMVKARCAALGYTVEENDKPIIDYISYSVSQYIKNFCNINGIPKELTNVVVDAISGELLYQKKSIGALGDNFNFEQAVTSIKEGDTQVSLSADTSPEKQFDLLINGMRTIDISGLLRFRKLVW